MAKEQTKQTPPASSTPPTSRPENPSLYATAAVVTNPAEMREVGGVENFPIFGIEGFEGEKPIGGIYLGTQTRGEDDEGKMRIVQVFENPNTKAKFGLWDRAGLANRLANVEVNTAVAISYHGKIPHPKKAGQTVHQFKVFQTAPSVQ